MTTLPSQNPYGTPLTTAKRHPVRDPLPEEHARFVQEFLADADPERAAMRAGLAPEMGAKLLSGGMVRAAICAARYARNDKLNIPQDYVLRRWIEAVEADHREISEHWRVPCRHCWGDDHHKQFDDVAWRDLVDERRRKRLELEAEVKSRRHLKDADEEIQLKWVESQMPPEELGGPGYTILREPMRGPDFVGWWAAQCERAGRALPSFAVANSDHTCPKCYGLGEPHAIIHDTRHYSRGAASLYLGVELTKDGYKIRTRDVEEIHVHIAKLMGYFVERKVVLVAGVDQMSEAELVERSKTLDAEYEELVARIGPPAGASDGGEPEGARA